MFAIALLAPEVVVFCATRQFLAAREMGIEMQKFFEDKEKEVEYTRALSALLSFELFQVPLPPE